MDPTLFYGPDDLPMTARQIRVAKLICASCPVKRDCFIEAVTRHEPVGVWGGYAVHERRAALLRNGGNLRATVADFDAGELVQRRRRNR